VMKTLAPGQQIQLTPKQMESAVSKKCQNKIVTQTELGPREHTCGCEYFMPAVRVSKISALISPTGQELTTQMPVLVCLECHKALG